MRAPRYGGGLAIACATWPLIVLFMHWLMSALSRQIFLENLGYQMVRQNYDLGDDPDLMKQIGDMLGESKLDEIRARLLEQGKLPPA